MQLNLLCSRYGVVRWGVGDQDSGKVDMLSQGCWGGGDSAGHVQVILATQVLVEKAEILKIIKRRQVMYMGLEQELLVK